MNGKYIGVDYGTKKVGIALSDEAGAFAFPHSIVPPQRLREVLEHISTGESAGVSGIVFGLSVATNGQDNGIAETVREVAQTVADIAPVFFEQEMFSSVEAHRYQVAKGDRDDSAAAIILQRFLDKNRK